jgi:hypothetical protein
LEAISLFDEYAWSGCVEDRRFSDFGAIVLSLTYFLEVFKPLCSGGAGDIDWRLP